MAAPTTASALPRPVLAYQYASDSVASRIALATAGALLIAASAQLVIPMWPAPITGQTLAVLVAGAAMGSSLGGATALLYLALAAAGLPFFAEGGSGVTHFLGPTVGYLVAFPIGAWLVGRLAERRMDRSYLTAGVIFALGTAVILLAGAIGFVFTIDYSLPEALAAQTTYLPGALLKGAIATLAMPLAWRATTRFDGSSRDAE